MILVDYLKLFNNVSWWNLDQKKNGKKFSLPIIVLITYKYVYLCIYLYLFSVDCFSLFHLFSLSIIADKMNFGRKIKGIK